MSGQRHYRCEHVTRSVVAGGVSIECQNRALPLRVAALDGRARCFTHRHTAVVVRRPVPYPRPVLAGAR